MIGLLEKYDFFRIYYKTYFIKVVIFQKSLKKNIPLYHFYQSILSDNSLAEFLPNFLLVVIAP